MQMRSVWLAVEVQVPEGLGDEASCLEHTEEDQLGLSAQWFNPIVLPGRPG